MSTLYFSCRMFVFLFIYFRFVFNCSTFHPFITATWLCWRFTFTTGRFTWALRWWARWLLRMTSSSHSCFLFLSLLLMFNCFLLSINKNKNYKLNKKQQNLMTRKKFCQYFQEASVVNPLTQNEWLTSNFSCQYLPLITHLGYENKGNDHQLKKLDC